ncbi:MAG: HAMP domain-containing protein [Myxococcales bacterium]|nr:HAMP domain-containing protein [Myxococcales bacterium]
MRLSLPGKVFAAFAVLLFTFGGVTAYSVFQVRQIGHDVGQLHATLLPLPAVVAGLNRDLQGLELLLEQTDPGALRRAVHLARRVRPYLEQLEAGFQRLDEGLAQSEAARSTWQELGALAGARGELGTELTRFFDAVDSGSEPEEARRAARQHLRVLRRGLGRIEREIGALIDQQVGAFAEEEAQVVWGAILLGAVSMIIGVAVTWLTGRLLRPLQILRAGVERVARGEYDQPVHVSGRGELSALAADFNRMAEAIRGRDAQLVAQQTELLHQERLATVGRMSAQITHELRNPLSSIGLNSELLLDDLEEEHPGRPLLVSIIREVERLREITEEYLRFARLPRPELRAVDLNHACEELAEFVRGEMEQAGVRLRVDADRAGRAARVDPNQLRAALLNLVRNAREAIGERGGHVVLRVRTLGEQVSVAVVDDGPGLSPAAREHLFEPFFSTRPQGTGLGLPMVRLILQAQQGRVDIDDTPGGGTTVTLVLPAAQPEDAP